MVVGTGGCPSPTVSLLGHTRTTTTTTRSSSATISSSSSSSATTTSSSGATPTLGSHERCCLRKCRCCAMGGLQRSGCRCDGEQGGG